MINQDQLTRGERIRLESLSQSMSATTLTSKERPSLTDILNNAEKIESWLKKAREDA